jgi:hypothetical protein
LLTGECRDDKLGRRAQQAYPLTSAFHFEGTARSRREIEIASPAARYADTQPRAMNHLQKSHVMMAQALEARLPANQRTKIDVSKITTDHEAQHYVSRVYALAAGRRRAPGKPCPCT